MLENFANPALMAASISSKRFKYFCTASSSEKNEFRVQDLYRDFSKDQGNWGDALLGGAVGVGLWGVVYTHADHRESKNDQQYSHYAWGKSDDVLSHREGGNCA